MQDYMSVSLFIAVLLSFRISKHDKDILILFTLSFNNANEFILIWSPPKKKKLYGIYSPLSKLTGNFGPLWYLVYQQAPAVKNISINNKAIPFL